MKAPFIDLVNSDWSDWHGSGRREDRLLDLSWVDRFLSKWGLQVSPVDTERLKMVLTNLRTLLDSEIKRIQAGESLSPAGLLCLEGVISRVPYRKHVVGDPSLEVDTEPEKKDPDWVAAQIAESFVDLLSKGDPRRLKTCANPDCGWLFYDDSRAMSRVWCDSQSCGNLLKVRRFRERKKQETST